LESSLDLQGHEFLGSKMRRMSDHPDHSSKNNESPSYLEAMKLVGGSSNVLIWTSDHNQRVERRDLNSEHPLYLYTVKGKKLERKEEPDGYLEPLLPF
jgi:hypothetical protein